MQKTFFAHPLCASLSFQHLLQIQIYKSCGKKRHYIIHTSVYSPRVVITSTAHSYSGAMSKLCLPMGQSFFFAQCTFWFQHYFPAPQMSSLYYLKYTDETIRSRKITETAKNTIMEKLTGVTCYQRTTTTRDGTTLRTI